MFARCLLVCLLGLGAMGLCLTVGTAQDKKPDEKKGDKKSEEGRKGTVTGLVIAKGDNWIEVKADGEEKARKYVPHWKGGAPKDGGGPDKEMVAEIKKVAVNSRVKLDWEFEERARVVKIEVLKKPEEKKKDEKK
jgi:hypothetical protein